MQRVASSWDAADVSIRRIGPDDLELIRAILGDPEMTAHLGGPQPDARIIETHQDYLADDAPGGVFAIVLADSSMGMDDPSSAGASVPGSPISVGWIGYWEAELHGTVVWEAGLSVLPAWQGRGIGSAAFGALLDHARAERRRRFVHAFVGVDNEPSNRMCENVGFERIGEQDIEYPPGNWTHCYEWRIALWQEA